MYKHVEFHGKCKNRIMPTKPVDSYKDDKVSEWKKYLAPASSSKTNNWGWNSASCYAQHVIENWQRI